MLRFAPAVLTVGCTHPKNNVYLHHPPCEPQCRRVHASAACRNAYITCVACPAGQALPEELEIQWLGPWHSGDLLHAHVNKVEGGLAGLAGLCQLHLQLRSTEYAPSGLNVGVLSSLQRLEVLEVEMQAADASGRVEAGPLASLTRLSLTHTPLTGHRFVDHGGGLSAASVVPAHLPALRLLQLGSWALLTLVGVPIPEFQQEAAWAWGVPEVELRGPTSDCKAFGLAPLALSAKGFFKLPELDYSQLTRLRLDRVRRLQVGTASVPRTGTSTRQAGSANILFPACTLSTHGATAANAHSWWQVVEGTAG